MKRLAIVGVISVCLLGGIPFEAIADEKALEERIKSLEKKLETLERHESEEARTKQMKEGEKPLSYGTTGSGKLIYAKPFVSAPKATVGGYMDFETNFLTHQNLTRSQATNFEVARFVPFIYSDITDRIKMAAEIEIEHGGPDNVSGGVSSNKGEIKIEFATIDYLVTEPLNFRAGILLMPVGKFNLLHDSPLNDLTDRPLVSRLIIPSTWFEPGLGLYGTLYPTRLSKLDYEVYAVNGFAATPGGITDSSGLRDARGRTRTDNNSNKGVVGRVAFSPILGIEVAGSGAYATYNADSDRRLGLWAVDWTLQRGPFELIGEAALARIEDNFSGAAIGPAGMRGYYVQGNYHFLPEFLKKWAPKHFTDASTFTAVVRWEEVDTDTDNRTLATGGNTRELERITIGLNFRPVEDTVFKFDYQFNSQLNTNVADGARIDGNGFLFSVATYF